MLWWRLHIPRQSKNSSFLLLNYYRMHKSYSVPLVTRSTLAFLSSIQSKLGSFHTQVDRHVNKPVGGAARPKTARTAKSLKVSLSPHSIWFKKTNTRPQSAEDHYWIGSSAQWLMKTSCTCRLVLLVKFLHTHPKPKDPRRQMNMWKREREKKSVWTG